MASTSIDDVCDEFACEPPNKSADPTPDDPLNWANFDCGESGDPIGSSPNKSAEEIAFAFLYFSLSTDFGDEYEDDDLKLRNHYVIENLGLTLGHFFRQTYFGNLTTIDHRNWTNLNRSEISNFSIFQKYLFYYWELYGYGYELK